MGHHNVASDLRTFCEYALSPILDFVLEHHHPTHPIELMPTYQLIGLVHYIWPILEFAIADEAGIIIFRA